MYSVLGLELRLVLLVSSGYLAVSWMSHLFQMGKLVNCTLHLLGKCRPSLIEFLRMLSSSHPPHSLSSCRGLWVLSPTRHLVEDVIGIFLHAVCSVAIHLVHANTSQFFLGRLINFEGYRVCPWTLLQSSRLVDAVLRVSGVESIFNCRQSAKFQRNCSIPTRAAVFPHETSVICAVVRLIIDTVY